MNNENELDVQEEGNSPDLISSIINTIKQCFVRDKEEPIRIAVIGEAGVGKTSTINALFNTDMPVNHFKPCTQEAEIVKTKTAKGIPLEVIDLPGLWAGEAETLRHWETYKKVIPTVDSAIWVISAGDRALEGMQRALRNIASFSGEEFISNIVFGINKAEHMFPEEWNTSINQPHPEQAKNLDKFCDTVRTAIREVFPNWNGVVRYYSALKQYRLDDILEQMLLTARKEDVVKIARAADPADATELIEDKRALKVAYNMINTPEEKK